MDLVGADSSSDREADLKRFGDGERATCWTDATHTAPWELRRWQPAAASEAASKERAHQAVLRRGERNVCGQARRSGVAGAVEAAAAPGRERGHQARRRGLRATGSGGESF
ncbi:hypothetical protein CDD80_5059 [Ophiocordyceps camponoti-rufipedis]|uniref:Uncharacterized protein n=1 Tax=Ophiocordyceps camponoti-rufipedis TaxID=2004952 RepID=A0A2C5YXC5_9HYPO|nr:hypothetical protein CDD80_5059 [Ophiocordyceps camponoti-rufipedis]